jgi:glycosyltransferase involved in cell wall biosynthesis
MMISIVIRTLNEEKFLPECLAAIGSQKIEDQIEVIIVDSGSTDRTLEIAHKFHTRIVFIKKEEFTFGRSLNYGCEAANGCIVVLISAHCIPTTPDWLANLVAPIRDGRCAYTYGRQVARDGVSKYSEGMVYRKYFPAQSAIPQVGYFCNNANSAISKNTWEKFRFNEALTGLEDMELAKRITEKKLRVGYVADAGVEHVHEENWRRIRIRYEREAIALQQIESSLSISLPYALKLYFAALKADLGNLRFFEYHMLLEVIMYRFCQFYGSYRGGHISRLKISKMKAEYFYPKTNAGIVKLGVHK